ncbi:MAG: hypothetical protein IFK94_03305 [Acidobacteria bacterium]|uniref:Uncharacterized protein n=1 Tax=Candidatus Polarisedimenticola svalbardensis TaxID=2886004 RepID=A0A8J6Y0U9_9BACT|nr:hypothetical protein [Candidatus Polarisedimenticola svalbardensis]
MRKRVRFSIAGLVLAAVAAGLIGWAGVVWVDLCRCEVQVDGAWTRLDNGYRHRLDLARDLLVLARAADGPGTDPAHRMRETMDGLERFAAMPVLPDDRDRYATYLAWQRRLGDILAEFTGEVRGGGDRQVDRLCDKLTEMEGRIREDLRQFDRSMGEFNGFTRSFPGSLVARVARIKQPGCPTGPAGPILAR